MARCRVDWDDGEDLIDESGHYFGGFGFDFWPNIAQQEFVVLLDQLANRFTCRTGVNRDSVSDEATILQSGRNGFLC